jgi:hypothetical protein
MFTLDVIPNLNCLNFPNLNCWGSESWHLLGCVIKETSFCLAEKDRLFLPGKVSSLQLFGPFQVLLMLLKMRLFFLIDRHQDW